MAKAGDRIRVQKYILGHAAYCDDYTVEYFRDCHGIFLSDEDRMAGKFTPLCELYDPAPDATQGYIPNHGPYWTAYVQGYMNLSNAPEPIPANDDECQHADALAGALEVLKTTACRTYAKWDADEDSKVGKWLAAMGGTKGILPEVDTALEILAYHQKRRAA